MKIAFLNSFYPPHIGGGAEISLATLVHAMKNIGHEVVVICTGPEPGIVEEFVDGIRVLRVGIKNYYWPYLNKDRSKFSRYMWHLRDSNNYQMGQLLKTVLHNEMPDVVSCHVLSGWSISAWKTMRALGIPIVQVLHDMYLLCPRSTMYRQSGACQKRCPQCSMLRLRHSKLSAHIDCVVGISKFILDKHLSFGYFANTPAKHVIHNTRSYPAISLATKSIRDGKVRFGFIGTLSKEKGIEWLLNIFSDLSKSQSIELLVAGTGKPLYAERLKSEYSSDSIIFMGKVNPLEFYPNIDVLIVPSMWDEPLGMVVPEALAHAVPVLASRRGGLPEMIISGKNGYLFDIENTEQIINLIKRFANDPSLISEMMKYSLDSAAPYINTTDWGNKYSNLYRSVIR